MTALLEADHVSSFDAKNYLMTRFDGQINDRSFMGFYLQGYHQFYQRFGHCLAESSLLEFGGGPSIYSLISAAPYVKRITFAEYVPSARHEVEIWQKNDPSSHNWSPYFKYVMEELESLSTSDDIINSREKELREKLCRVVPCNIRSDNPLVGIVDERFDIIHQNFALECAFETKEGYKTGLEKLCNLLKPRGLLAILVTEDRMFYTVNGKTFKTAYITSEDVHGLLVEVGFSIEMSSIKPVPVDMLDIYMDCKAMEFIVARRID